MSLHARIAEEKLKAMSHNIYGQLGARWEHTCNESLKIVYENNDWHVYCDGEDVGVIRTSYSSIWPKTENFSIALYDEAGKPTIDFELYNAKAHIVGGTLPNYVEEIEIIEEDD